MKLQRCIACAVISIGTNVIIEGRTLYSGGS